MIEKIKFVLAVGAIVAVSGCYSAADGAPNLPPKQLTCLTQNVYHEARGESTEGWIAVANVTLRRHVLNNESVCKVVFKPKQFTWTKKQSKRSSKAIKEKTTFDRIQAVVSQPDLPDFSNGATHFYNSDYPPPVWAKDMVVVAKIGRHVFLRDSEAIDKIALSRLKLVANMLTSCCVGWK